MNSYNRIVAKLEQFSKKFYTRMLVKGLILFMVLGIIFFLVVLGIEYFLWLSSGGRLALFICFLLVELFLLYSYILVPVFYLVRLKQGISNKQASLLIGKHFPEIGDKLFNLLDLAEEREQTELWVASIEQRSVNLDRISFVKAIDFSESYSYARYLLIPGAIVALVWVSGSLSSFFGSYTRVVNYDMAFQPPAPFVFRLVTPNLEVLDNESFTLKVVTEGTVKPETVSIVVNGNEYFMQQVGEEFHFSFDPPLEEVSFYFLANEVSSGTYRFKVLHTPRIQDFSMSLVFPAYLGRSSEVVKSTGNATIPEGTRVKWNIVGKDTERVALVAGDSTFSFKAKDGIFEFNRRIFADFEYQLNTSNRYVRDFEKLDYRFTVIRDAYPEIEVERVADSLNANTVYFSGEASDDYGVSAVNLVYYAEGDEGNKKSLKLITPNVGVSEFYYTLPSGIDLEAGDNYSFYFEAVDNDAIHKGKRTRSAVFSQVMLDSKQLKKNQLEQQQSLIGGMERTLEGFKEQEESLKEISGQQRQKNNLNFNEQQQMKDFFLRQQQQEVLRQKFSTKLKENLERSERDDRLNELLQERLERQELEAKKNEKLLEELNKIADKIDKEELGRRLEELANKQQNSERGLEQLLELTKRYYVGEKAAQLASELEELAKEQESLVKDNLEKQQELEKQEEMNQKFSEVAKELEELRKDNAALKKPMEMGESSDKEEDIKTDQKDALQELKKGEGEEKSSKDGERVDQKQKSAADKMKELSESLQEGSSSDSEATIAEDAEMLRQILDNLIVFSFQQEALYEGVNDGRSDIVQFSETVRKQKELRSLFEHVDDSLFSLSLRRAELAEFVNEQITAVYYNNDKALDRMVEGQMNQAGAYQQYVLTAANDLADFLAVLLENMQESMKSGKGSGNAPNFQLPDIIKGQGELKGKMEGMAKQGQTGKEQGESGEEGEGKGQGEGRGESSSGKQGKQGKQGEGMGQGEGSTGGPGGNELGESELEEIYQIYKEQQMLKEQLEQQLQDMINADDRKLGEKLLRQMEDFQNGLLENGVTQQSIARMNTISYELLKLKNAEMKQGVKEKRESAANKQTYINPIISKPRYMDNFRKEEEILQRQALPLQQNFQYKVKDYFKIDD